MVRWQILQAINALIDVRQRKQIEKYINGRKHPQQETVADEVAAERRQFQSVISADVI